MMNTPTASIRAALGALCQLLVLFVCTPGARAQTSAASQCDVNHDASVNVSDVQLLVNMTLQMAPCTANIAGDGVCNVVVLQRVINAALGQTCITGGAGSVNPHSATLSWTASTSSGVTGYNVYRSAVSGGPYTKVNATLVAGTSFVDTNVQAGQAYYYVATAVNSAAAESPYSNEAKAVVPSP